MSNWPASGCPESSNVALTALRSALAFAAATACGSISTPTTGLAPSLAAAIARTGAAAIVEQVPPGGDGAFQPFQAQAGGRVRSGAGHPGSRTDWTIASGSGASCQEGTIHSRSEMRIG